MRQSADESADCPLTGSRSNSPTICRWSMWTPVLSKNRLDSFWRMRPNTPRPARRYRSTRGPKRGRVILSVSDQGVGITPDEQHQLGRRSFRSQRHQATIPGSGLGFWIASTFVRANGGSIDISSRGHGLGATASIALPGSRTGATGLSNE